MTALLFLIGLGLVFAAIWGYMSRNPGPRAKLGPDGTNVREPETFVVHHEGKGEGLDIANTALKERTEDVRRDLPGDAHQVKAPVPGRDTVRDVELAADLAPGPEPDQQRADTDVTGPVELGTGHRRARRALGKVIEFRSRTNGDSAVPEDEDEEITFEPDPSLAHELGAELDWSTLDEDLAMPMTTGDDVTVAMVRNPHSLYVYFERGGQEEHLRAMLGEEEWQLTTPCLRIVDLTEPEGDVTVEVSGEDDHLFINDSVRPGHRYMISYGRRDSRGVFHELSHSAPVQMPFGGPVEAVESEMLYQMYARQPGQAGSLWK